jgi:hypothetical protein
MTTTEKLQALKARCEALLETASRPLLARDQQCGCRVCNCENEYQCQGCGATNCGTHPAGQIPNPIYISTHLDGPAEAGWRATIAAIDFITEFRLTKWGWDGDCGVGAYTDNLEDEIITAWEGLI